MQKHLILESPLPLVGLAIPTFNRDERLEQTLSAVLDALPKNFPILVVDDGSTDNTAKVIESFASRSNLLSISHSDNRGLGGAFLSIAKANFAEYVLISSDDDVLLAGSVSQITSFLSRRQTAQMLVPQFLSSEGSIYRGRTRAMRIKPEDLRLAVSHLPGIVFARDLLQEAATWLERDLENEVSLANIYPQFYCAITSFGLGKSFWCPFPTVQDAGGARFPSRIRDSIGRPYTDGLSRVNQALELKSLVGEFLQYSRQYFKRRALKTVRAVAQDFLLESIDLFFRQETTMRIGVRRIATHSFLNLLLYPRLLGRALAIALQSHSRSDV